MSAMKLIRVRVARCRCLDPPGPTLGPLTWSDIAASLRYHGVDLLCAPFALASRCAGRRNLARLHQFANVSGGTGKPLTSCVSEGCRTYDWRKALPPSSFSCSAFTESTRSHKDSRLACNCFACLITVSTNDDVQVDR